MTSRGAQRHPKAAVGRARRRVDRTVHERRWHKRRSPRVGITGSSPVLHYRFAPFQKLHFLSAPCSVAALAIRTGVPPGLRIAGAKKACPFFHAKRAEKPHTPLWQGRTSQRPNRIRPGSAPDGDKPMLKNSLRWMLFLPALVIAVLAIAFGALGRACMGLSDFLLGFIDRLASWFDNGDRDEW